MAKVFTNFTSNRFFPHEIVKFHEEFQYHYVSVYITQKQTFILCFM